MLNKINNIETSYLNNNVQNNNNSSAIYTELKAKFPEVNIQYQSTSPNLSDNKSALQAFGCSTGRYGNLYNVTIDPAIAQKMESDSNYRKKILSQVSEQLTGPIPTLPGVKVASAGAIVSSDGSVTGYIIGEPTESEKARVKQCEKENKIKREKENEEKYYERKKLLKKQNEQYEAALLNRANLLRLSNIIK